MMIMQKKIFDSKNLLLLKESKRQLHIRLMI